MDIDKDIGLIEALEVLRRYSSISVLLRFKEGKSDKFYNLDQDGGSYQTSWGKWRGFDPSGGQSKNGADPLSFSKTLRSKVRKGYKVVQIKVSSDTKTQESNPQLEEISYLRKPSSGNHRNHYSTWGENSLLLALIPSATACELFERGIPLRSY